MTPLWMVLSLAVAKPPTVAFPPVPVPGPPATWTPPAPTVEHLANGLPVYIIERHGAPLASVRVVLRGGSADDPVAKAGLACLSTEMMATSAGERSALEQAAALDRLAAGLSVDCGVEWATASLDVHRDRLKDAVPLLADAVRRPGLRDEDWGRIRDQHLSDLALALEQNTAVGAVVANHLLFGSDHPYGHIKMGTAETVSAVTLDDVKSFVAAHVRANATAFVVTGDVDAATAKTLLDSAFGDWALAEPTPAPPPLLRAKAKRRLVLVNLPGEQTYEILAWPGPPGDAGDRIALELAATVLGGTFKSRLNQRLRIEKGYTYGASLYGRGLLQGGVVQAGARVQGDASAPALGEFLAVLETARSGFTETERATARAQAINGLVDSVETQRALADVLAAEIRAGRDPQRWPTEGAAIDKVTLQDMLTAYNTWVDPANALIVLVGDQAKLEPALKAAGYADFEVVDRTGH